MNRFKRCEVRLVDVIYTQPRGPPKDKKKTTLCVKSPKQENFKLNKINYKNVNKVKLPSKATSQTARGCDNSICVGDRDLRSSKKKLSEPSQYGKGKKMKMLINESFSSPRDSHNYPNNDVSISDVSQKSGKSIKGNKICCQKIKTNIGLFSQSNLTGAKRVSKRLTNLKMKNRILKKMSLEFNGTLLQNGKHSNKYKKATLLDKSCPKVILDSNLVQSKIKNKGRKTKKWKTTNETITTSQPSGKYSSEHSNNSLDIEDSEDNILTTNKVKSKMSEDLEINNDCQIDIDDFCNKFGSEGFNDGLVCSEEVVESENLKISSIPTSCNPLNGELNNDAISKSSPPGAGNYVTISKSPEETCTNDTKDVVKNGNELNDQARLEVLDDKIVKNSCEELNEKYKSSNDESPIIIPSADSKCYSVAENDLDIEEIVIIYEEDNELDSLVPEPQVSAVPIKGD